MIPEPITIGGKTGTVLYLDAHWHPVPADKATAARVLFDDGSTAFFTAEAPTQKREYVRDEQGQFAEVFHGTAREHLDSILREGLKAEHAGEVWPTYSLRGFVYMTTNETEARKYAETTANRLRDTEQHSVALITIRIPEDRVASLRPDMNFDKENPAFKTAKQFRGDIPPEWIVGAKIGRKNPSGEMEWEEVPFKKAAADGQLIYVVVVLHSSAAKREYVRDEKGRFAETGGWPLADDAPRTYTMGEANAIDHVYEPWTQGLTKEERGAIERYTASEEWGPSGHRVMNGVLQGRYDAKAQTNPDLARIKAKAEEHAAVLMGALAKAPAPPPPDLVWRGVTGDISRLIPDLTPGTEVALKGFQSTTVDPKVASGFGDTILEITPTAGAYVSGEQLVKSFPQGEHMYGGGEQELLLPHNARYRVRGVLTVLVGGVSKRVVQLEMLR